MMTHVFYLIYHLFTSKRYVGFRLAATGKVVDTRIGLNRIFADFEECHIKDGLIYLRLNSSDYRASHIKKVLKLQEGDSVKVGVVDMGLSDAGQLIESSRLHVLLAMGPVNSFLMNDPPLVDLILAVPRPLRLERLLPVISSLGVGTVVLIGASKVEKAFFGSHLFREPKQMRAALVEGLSQARVDCLLPRVIVRRDFQSFLTEDLDALFPLADFRRVVAHPLQDSLTSNNVQLPRRLTDLVSRDDDGKRRVVVAVGPEGGWEDSEVAGG